MFLILFSLTSLFFAARKLIITAIQLQRGSTKTDFPPKQIEDSKEEEDPSLLDMEFKK